MLELMSPGEYTADVRPVLGHGSGFDSPGWNRVRHAAPALLQAFNELRRKEGLSWSRCTCRAGNERISTSLPKR